MKNILRRDETAAAAILGVVIVLVVVIAIVALAWWLGPLRDLLGGPQEKKCPPGTCDPTVKQYPFVVQVKLTASAPCFGNTVISPNMAFLPGGPGGPAPPSGGLVTGNFEATVNLAITYPGAGTYLWNSGNDPDVLSQEKFNVGACSNLFTPGYGEVGWTFFGCGPSGYYQVVGSGQVNLVGSSTSTQWTFEVTQTLPTTPTTPC